MVAVPIRGSCVELALDEPFKYIVDLSRAPAIQEIDPHLYLTFK